MIMIISPQLLLITTMIIMVGIGGVYNMEVLTHFAPWGIFGPAGINTF